MLWLFPDWLIQTIATARKGGKNVIDQETFISVANY